MRYGSKIIKSLLERCQIVSRDQKFGQNAKNPVQNGVFLKNRYCDQFPVAQSKIVTSTVAAAS
jgi:hypothetical protein